MSIRKSDLRNVEQRSVEEVILRRKLEKMALAESKSMPALHNDKSRVGFLPAITPNQHTQHLPTRSASNTNIHAEKNNEEQQKMYSEKDVRKMMENVMKYCRVLQSRVQELEVKGIAGEIDRQPGEQPQNDIQSSHQLLSTKSAHGNHIHLSELAKPRAHNEHWNTTTKSKGLEDPFVNREIISSLDNKIGALRDIFRQVDPLEERRMAAVKIQAIIRGFLARARKRYYYQGVREWRWVRCRPVIWVLDILLSNQSKLDSGFHLLTMNRTMKTLNSIYTKWAAVYRQNVGMRRTMRRAVEERIWNKRHGFMLKHFAALREVTIGIKSRKHASNERRKMIDQIRATLSKKLMLGGDLGVVPDSEIMKVLNRRVVEEFQSRKQTLSKMYKFRAFKKLVEMAKSFQKAARTFRYRQLAGRCFFAWSEHTYLKSRGLDRKRWPGPRKYEVRYNQKRVDNFARIRCERVVFAAWKAYFGIQHIVKLKYQHKVAMHMKAVFLGWKSIAKHQHDLRLQTYQNWVGYAGLMTEKPFKAWADFVKGQKNQYHEHLRIAKSYRRWKTRQKLAQIVKVWRHQALFGRLDGLYTRQMLLKTLGEQKMFTSTLEKLMADQTLELDECKRVLHEEIEKRKHGESEITQLNSTINHMKMTNHHYEQELKRLTATVDSMAMINPKQMQHMQEKMPEFKFRERHIALNSANEDLLGSSLPLPSILESEEARDDNAPTILENVTAPTPAAVVGEADSKAESKEITSASTPVETPAASGTESDHHKQPATVTMAQSLAMKLVEGGGGGGGDAFGAEASALESSATPVPGDANTTAAKTDGKPTDPDQLPPAVNTLENQRILERCKWIIERYKLCNPMNFDFDTAKGTDQQESALANARAMSASADSDAREQEGLEGTTENRPLGNLNTSAHEESDQQTVDDTICDSEIADTVIGRSRPTTRGSVVLTTTTATTNSAAMNSSSFSPSHNQLQPARSNSYMAIANSSLPGLRLPDPILLQRSPSKSLLRASNPFVKGIDVSASFAAHAGSFSGTSDAITDALAAIQTVSSPQAASNAVSPTRLRTKSRGSRSIAAMQAPSFDDEGSLSLSPSSTLRKSPSRSNMMGKSLRASYSRQPSMSFSPSSLPTTQQQGQQLFSPPQSGGAAAINENMLMAMGYDPTQASPSQFGGAGEVFYEDNELEDVVITWAKMLFTVMEFLESGK